jgi:hypothetical protein
LFNQPRSGIRESPSLKDKSKHLECFPQRKTQAPVIALIALPLPIILFFPHIIIKLSLCLPCFFEFVFDLPQTVRSLICPFALYSSRRLPKGALSTPFS